jgi:DNA topoisomerase IA
VEPTGLQKEREAKEQLAEKHITRGWEKELQGVETIARKWKELVDNLCS